MISKRWILKPKPKTTSIERLSKEMSVEWILAALLIQRDIHTLESAKEFFKPRLENLHNPFLMKGMKKAVERICTAMESGEKIMIYGDYDVDGTTSVSLLYGFLQEKGYPYLSYYIPDRYSEGYGISFAGIDEAEKRDVSLVIALDCGIKAIDKIDYANEKGIDFIICDHHTPGEKLPLAHAILNPKQKDCEYPYKELSGCGVGFKLIQGICLYMSYDPRDAFAFLDLVAVSIASDIVPINGENRILCHFGLSKINQRPSSGLDALIQIADYQNKAELNVRDLVFGLGPRINAAGRMDKAISAVELLLEKSPEKALEMASYIDEFNKNRRNFDSDITREAVEMIEKEGPESKAKSTVLFKEDWHKGVIGIVASRCIEHYHRPTIILTQSNGKATGSARSVPGYNIYDAILKCEDLLDSFGGHQFAAGLTMEKNKVEEFKSRFESIVSESIHPEQLIPQIDIDLEIELNEINAELLRKINFMAPFGPENMSPVFCTRNVKLHTPLRILKERHLKIQVKKANSNVFDCIGFNMAEYEDLLLANQSFDICYSITINEFRGVRSIQLNLRDIKAE